jgi:hypothetical protein
VTEARSALGLLGTPGRQGHRPAELLRTETAKRAGTTGRLVLTPCRCLRVPAALWCSPSASGFCSSATAPCAWLPPRPGGRHSLKLCLVRKSPGRSAPLFRTDRQRQEQSGHTRNLHELTAAGRRATPRTGYVCRFTLTVPPSLSKSGLTSRGQRLPFCVTLPTHRSRMLQPE